MRILVVQTAYLGDVVLTTPLLTELKRAQPDAHLTLLTTPAGRSLLASDARVDALMALSKAPTPRGKWSYARVLLALGRGRFDVAIAAHRSIRSGVLVRVSGAAERVGFAGAPGAWAYTREVEWRGERHAVWRYLALSEFVGGRPDGANPEPRLPIDALARERVLSALGFEGAIACLAPGSVRATKRWTADGFAAVGRAARERGLLPVIVGSPAERELCLDVARRTGEPSSVLAGRIDVPQLVALIAHARIVVANDSGPGHIATAVGTPVVSIFGPTSPSQGYAPFGQAVRTVEHPALACRPCSAHGPRACPLGHFLCMRDLTPAAVVRELDRLLARSGGPGRPRARRR